MNKNFPLLLKTRASLVARGKNLPANGGDTGSIPGPGKVPHAARAANPQTPQPLSLWSRTRDHTYWATGPRACALQQENPLQWETCTLQLESPCSNRGDPAQPKINNRILLINKIKIQSIYKVKSRQGLNI